MAGLNIRSALLSKDKKRCYNYIASNLTGQDLVQFIYEILYISALVKYDGKLIMHPICVMNSIKNFIGDDKNKPSKKLLRFAINYLFTFDFRNNDQTILDKSIKNNLGEIAFIGMLEDACQIGNWELAEEIMIKTYIASDRSRAILDILAELGLQNAPHNALFIYHLLRAYQFQEIKNDNWTFIRCGFGQIKLNKLEDAHMATDITPDMVKKSVIQSDNLIYFTFLERIWNGNYVRIRGYRRELSHWLSKLKFNELLNVKLINNHFLMNITARSFINFAEIIIKKEKTQNEIAKDLVILEAVRFLSKQVTKNELAIIGSRFNKILKS
tara:strand:+ start:2815 stop:3795 length:981 start_codon:yes stop_codon:yes gene_type:complete